MDSKSVVNSIEQRVLRLLDEQSRLETLCSKLQAQNADLESRNRTLQGSLAQAQHELDNFQLSDALAGNGDDEQRTKRARARVNRLMREVDKCIALLNRYDK